MQFKISLATLGLYLASLTPAFSEPIPDAGSDQFLERDLAKRGMSNRIIGGTPASFSNYEYIAYFKIKENDNFRCTADLIAPNVVLAPAHCLYNPGYDLINNLDLIQIGLGSVDPITDSSSNIYKVKSVEIHPEYTNKDPYKDDLALLFLDECVSTDVAVPIEIDTTPIDRNGRFITAGFGITVFGNGAVSVLNELNVSQGRQDYCNTMFPTDNAAGKVFCVGVTNTSTICSGDSGGPITGTDYKKLNGIASTIITVNGKSCDADSTVGVYMMMSYYWDNFISKYVSCTGPNCEVAECSASSSTSSSSSSTDSSSTESSSTESSSTESSSTESSSTESSSTESSSTESSSTDSSSTDSSSTDSSSTDSSSTESSSTESSSTDSSSTESSSTDSSSTESSSTDSSSTESSSTESSSTESSSTESSSTESSSTESSSTESSSTESSSTDSSSTDSSSTDSSSTDSSSTESSSTESSSTDSSSTESSSTESSSTDSSSTDSSSTDS
ncbi:hypothetical protein AX774_g2887, partial [Zancudomyces culisetae]